MIDPLTQTAKYVIAGKDVYLRKLTVSQMARLETFKASEAWAELMPDGKLSLSATPKALATLLSIALTDADKQPVTVTEDDVGSLEIFDDLGVMLSDFFTLHPALLELTKLSLSATLNSFLEAVAGTGGPENSGITSPPAPAAETSGA
ncbi:MAG: hypothetical protein PHI18_00150 [bacterium]|nr:hypothetical protein [bacterium]